MDGVNNLVAIEFQVQHSVSQEVPSRSLDGRLEDTASDQLVASPLSGVRVLTMHRNAELFGPPWSDDQLELWPLPAN
jgi:hypothetical protein